MEGMMGGISEVCAEFHALNTEHEVAADAVQKIVEAMVVRQPLREGVPSHSHIMWLSRETTKLLVRHVELMKRESLVSKREAAVRACSV